MSDTTGGKYFYAKDAADLNSIYNNLGLNIVLKTQKQECNGMVYDGVGTLDRRRGWDSR